MGRCHEYITIEECEEIMVARREGKNTGRPPRRSAGAPRL